MGRPCGLSKGLHGITEGPCNCWEFPSPKALGGLQAPTGQSYLCPEGSRLPGFLSLKLSMASSEATNNPSSPFPGWL